jgi:hypothetical protein
MISMKQDIINKCVIYDIINFSRNLDIVIDYVLQSVLLIILDFITNVS